MPELIPVLTEAEIDKSVTDIAKIISAEYKGCELILIGVLKGAFIFLSDLSRKIDIPLKIDFARISSYGAGTSTSGNIKLLKDIEIEIEGKDLLIVEDIVDTGTTISHFVDYLKNKNAKSVKVCTLIDKRERRETEVTIDYACHVVDEGFLVGYGLDYAEDYRELPGIYHLKF